MDYKRLLALTCTQCGGRQPVDPESRLTLRNPFVCEHCYPLGTESKMARLIDAHVKETKCPTK